MRWGSMFGGPWGLALADATAAVMAIVDANNKTDQAQGSIAASARDAAEAVTTYYSEIVELA
ncbi:hypothetical protein [Corynebacterium vitaeruminis]|nr:hypothetical protein [Corynebacterium vitaeruminis]